MQGHGCITSNTAQHSIGMLACSALVSEPVPGALHPAWLHCPPGEYQCSTEQQHAWLPQVQYDTLVVAVGEQPASFGVPGVHEHCFFMKEIRDCVDLRTRIGTLFELSNLPGTPEEERCATISLHFSCM
jgi:hypothetical protein